MNQVQAGRRAISPLLLSALLALGSVSGDALAAFDYTKDLIISLKFVPTDVEEVLQKQGVLPGSGPPVEIVEFVDSREGSPDLVGLNRETGLAVKVRATTPVAPWVTKSFLDTVATWGFRSSRGADLLLEGKILALQVLEKKVYVAQVNLEFTLRRRDGTVLWSGTAGGAAERFGRSLKPDNYQEVLSDAAFSSFAKLWMDPGFREAWAGKKAGQAAQGTGAAVKPAPSETLDPDVAMRKALALKEAGFLDDALIAWVKKIAFTRPLTSDDMLTWKAAGVPQAVITAAME